MDNTLSEKDFAAMAGMDAAIIEQENLEDVSRNAILAIVSASVSKKVYAEILDEISESGYTHSYAIIDKPVGREEKVDASWRKHFVNQTTNGGYSGDDYAGTVSIPIGGGKFFHFAYSL